MSMTVRRATSPPPKSKMPLVLVCIRWLSADRSQRAVKLGSDSSGCATPANQVARPRFVGSNGDHRRPTQFGHTPSQPAGQHRLAGTTPANQEPHLRLASQIDPGRDRLGGAGLGRQRRGALAVSVSSSIGARPNPNSGTTVASVLVVSGVGTSRCDPAYVQTWLAAAEISAGPVFRAVALGGKVSAVALADASARERTVAACTNYRTPPTARRRAATAPRPSHAGIQVAMIPDHQDEDITTTTRNITDDTTVVGAEVTAIIQNYSARPSYDLLLPLLGAKARVLERGWKRTDAKFYPDDWVGGGMTNMVSMVRTVSSLGAVFALSLMASGVASASPITYDFTVTATDGPLSGTTEGGTFSYDSSSTVAGGGQNAGAGLLTALSFSWNGIAYDQTRANTGFLDFNASGELIRAVFGTDCAAGCIVPASTNAWAFNLSPAGGPLEFFYTVSGNAGLFEGSVTAELAVPAPEPNTLALLGIGCAVVGAARRSRRNALA